MYLYSNRSTFLEGLLLRGMNRWVLSISYDLARLYLLQKTAGSYATISHSSDLSADSAEISAV